MPYKKLTALAQDYAGCDIEVEVALFAAGWSNQVCTNAPVEGKAQFEFIEPGGQAATNPLSGASGFMGLIAKGASDPVLSAKTGDHLILRGGMFYQAFGASLPGQGVACFVATSARPSDGSGR